MDISVDQVQHYYAEHVLKNYRNFPAKLKPDQEIAIQAVLEGRDVLAIFPTGFGKSLIIFVPPILLSKIKSRKSICLVISPLTSIMMDMQRKLGEGGLRSIQCSEQNVKSGDLEQFLLNTDSTSTFLLSAPEVRELLKRQSPDYVFIDEGHLVTQWGENFRRDYGLLNELRSFVKAPFILLTATLTISALADVKRKAGLFSHGLLTVAYPATRPEIYLQLMTATRKVEALSFVVEGVKKAGRESLKTIIFVPTIPQSTKVFLWIRDQLGEDGILYDNGIQAGYFVEIFSSCTRPGTKERILKSFLDPEGIVRVIVATTALSHGVDVPNVRRVILWGGLPTELAILWQEIGRAARDGGQGHAVIYPVKVPNFPPKYSIPTDSCMKEYINSAFFHNKKRPTITLDFTHSSCSITKCTCPLCLCCSYCFSKCDCADKRDEFYII